MSIKTTTPPTLAASIAGRYVIVRELGRGGMATVYLANDLVENRQVAVKILHPDLAASIGGDRFLREIELGKVLRHDRIVSVLDSGEVAGQLYYTMPFVEGESLRDRLDRQRQLTIDETIAITRQVSEALDHAHSKAVVHRDIKPENILLSGDQAFVMDFGIAHAVTTAGGEKLTKTGMAVGTPAYMSPEQAVGAKDVTPQSDIYSLGCVVYEMLAGEPPFNGANAMALLAKHSLESVPSIRVVRASVPDELEDAIFCAMEKTPVDRFKSAGDFARALAGEIAVPKHSKNRTAAGMRVAPRSNKGMLIGAAAALVLLAGGGFGAWRYMGARGVQSRIGTDTDPTHIAVLYFEDGSPKRDLGYVADGLTEALIHELSAVKQLRVISRNGVVPFKGKPVSPDSLGKLLKVGTVVSGKISQAGDKLRLDVSLVDALDGKELASTRIDQPRDSVLALQDELAKDVADQLRKKLGQEQLALQQRISTRNDKAWEAFQRAKQTLAGAEELRLKRDAPAAMRQYETADAELAAVEKLEGKWNEPTVQRAWIAFQQAQLTANADPSKIPGFVTAGIGHAERALARAATDADALEIRGTLRYYGFIKGMGEDDAASTQLIKGAEDDLKSAAKLNPQQAGAWNILSHLYIRKSRPSEAKIAADRALDADPYLAEIEKTMWRRFQASLDMGDRTEAVKACDGGQRRFPEYFRFAECRLWLHAMKGGPPSKPEDIWRDYDRFVEMAPKSQQPYLKEKGKMMAALGLVRAGLPDSARSLAEATQLNIPQDPEKEILFLRAVVHAQIATPKDKDEVIRLLKRFYAGAPKSGDSDGGEESWWFEKMTSDPRYKELMG